MKKNLSPNTLFALIELFQKKEWKITENDVRESLYLRFCDRLKILDVEEQKLFIELSYRFEQIGINKYLECFLMSFHCLNDEILSKKNKIIISPLSMPYLKKIIDPEKTERPRTKSSQFLFYFLTAQDIRWVEYSSKFEFYETISEIKKNFNSKDTLLLLIDDFIGTGETAVTCCKSIIKEISAVKDICIEDIGIITIAALEKGVERIKDEMNIITYCDFIRKKGISDYCTLEDVPKKKDIMIGIEGKLYCNPIYSLGFGESEALISFMNKTPNNTFPAFWHETETKIAPFPRYKNYK